MRGSCLVACVKWVAAQSSNRELLLADCTSGKNPGERLGPWTQAWGGGEGSCSEPNLPPARSAVPKGTWYPKECHGASTPGFPTCQSWSKSIPSLPSRTSWMAPASWGIPTVFPDSWSSQKSERVLVFCKLDDCPKSLGNQRVGIVSEGKQSKPKHFKQKQLFEVSSFLFCFGFFFKAFPELPGWERAFKFSFSFRSRKKPFPAVVPSKINLIFFH